MTHAIEMSRQARTYVARQDARAQERLGLALRQLQAAPFHQGTKQLKGRPERSARVGSWRIPYTVADDPPTVEVRAIAPRGEVYRRL